MVTLSLMVLLCVIAVGLLNLSSISLRDSERSVAMASARQNARLSLQLAIGQLQSLTGQDTRVTASRMPEDPSAALDSVVPVTGVWRSWEGSDHENNGRPIAPNYASKQRAGDPAAKPGSSSDGRFLGWLVSPGAWNSPNPNTVPDVTAAIEPGYVPLVSDGSVTEPKRRVFIKPTLVNASKGAIAWWTCGENSKANVAPDEKPAGSSSIPWQERARAHGVPSPKGFGLGTVPQMPVPTTGTLALLATDATAASGHFHDETVWSSGLLTNAATGGWKRDLSLMTEKYDGLPATQLPFFNLKPGQSLRFSKAAPAGTTPGAHPDRPLLYPWAQYLGAPSAPPNEQVPPIVSWDYLRNACVEYQQLTPLTPATGRTGIPWALASWWASGGTQYRYEFLDQPRRWPALCRIYYTFSFASVPDPTRPDNLKAAMILNPVVVLWNPYNLEITIPYEFGIGAPSEITPTKFAFSVGGTSYPAVSLNQITGQKKVDPNQIEGSNSDLLLNDGPGTSMTLRPGESRLYSVTDPNPVPGDSVKSGYWRYLKLTPGYRTYGGFIYTTLGAGRAEISAPKGSQFKVDLTFNALVTGTDTNFYYEPDGYGSVLDCGYNDPANSAANGFTRRTSRQWITVTREIAEKLWPPIFSDNLPYCTLDEVQGNTRNKVFISAVLGLRTANDATIPTKGAVQTNPLAYFSFPTPNMKAGMGTAGFSHPANSACELQFINGADLSARPNVEPTTNRGYIVSGMDASSGLTTCVSAEIPTRPLQSLCELQHFDLRNNNPLPPYPYNIFGNSQATPLLPANAVSRSDYQHDDSYCLNHAFFDDWFVSSIARDLRDWSNQTDLSLDEVYKDFLDFHQNAKTGSSPLPNRMYRPTAEAMAPDPIKAYERDVKPADSYLHIASKLEVAGMFNVNSTSVKAWKALLGHALGQRQPYMLESGGNWQVALAPARDHVASRLSVAGGGAAGIDPPRAGAFADALEFSGYRVLSDAQIDALAEQIVDQIRKRGPFLSLAEFINRQLTTTNELALAGTVQAALDALAARGTGDPTNPFARLQKNSDQITPAVVNAMPLSAEAKYLFQDAAYGWSANGVPGWLRQADILSPLAPLLAARDDTFVIRSYGDARDAQGNVTACAWCEAVVQRSAGFIDPTDAATDTPVLGTDNGTEKFLQAAANARFGRSFKVISFRWLDPKEI